jgi:hypothetical protein
LKRHERAVKRAVSIKFSTKVETENTKPLTVEPKERDMLIQAESSKLLLSEETRVDNFVNGLRHKKSHFLITKPTSMEEENKVEVKKASSKRSKLASITNKNTPIATEVSELDTLIK